MALVVEYGFLYNEIENSRTPGFGDERGAQDMDIERIREMEGYLNECTAATADLEAQLERMDGLGEGMTRLFAYYGSEAWYEDREGTLPPGIAAGVLSEDLVYDQITAVRDAAIRMLELATDILKNRI